MAKRKRLTPALFGSRAENEALNPALEPHASRPPIAHVAGEAASAAALEEVAGVLADARAEGRLIQKLPLDAIVTDHLIRDRVGLDPDELEALRESLKARGQQVPIEVVALDGDPQRYGLISGLRRVVALRDLGVSEVLALIRSPESSEAAYIAMVEENEIRAGVSLYERGRLAHEAVAAGLYSDPYAAIRALWANASRAKRSKIGSFMAVHAALGDVLRFPAAIPERLGLRLAQALSDEGARDRLCAALSGADVTSAEAERTLLEATLDPPASRRENRAKPAVQSLSQGVQATPGRGRLALSGKALTPELQSELIAWLEDRLARK